MLAELKPLMELLDAFFEETKELLDGLNVDQLNWRPISGDDSGEATNSLYGLALHISFVAMRGASNAARRIMPEYPEMNSGNNAVSTRGESAERAIQILNEAQLFVRDVLFHLTPEQLEELRERRVGNWVGEPKSVRWLMLHILEHTALHIGHMELTRQLLLKSDRG